LNRLRNHFSQLLNVHGVRQREIHTAEALQPEHRAFEEVYFFLQISNDGKLLLVVHSENSLSDFFIILRATRVALLPIVYM
jgi:hypothetical protein